MEPGDDIRHKVFRRCSYLQDVSLVWLVAAVRRAAWEAPPSTGSQACISAWMPRILSSLSLRRS